MSSSSVQINNHTFGGKQKSDRGDSQQIHYPGNVLQFKTHQHLQAQIGMGNKTRLPYPSPYSTSSTASSSSGGGGGGGGEVINLSNNKNRTSGGSAYSPYSRSSGGAKSPKSSTSSTNGNGMFIGTTSILDNLLKNPRTHLEAAIAAAAAAHNAAAAAAANNEANDNNDMVQYEAEGYLENCRSSPHNLTAAHLRQLQEQHGAKGHPPYYISGGGGDDDNNMEMTMTEDSTPIPAHLLEPNVEYHIGAGAEYPDRYGTLHNPLADLAKVAAASIKHQPTTGGGGNKRGSKKVPQQQQVDGNGEITSSKGSETTTPVKPKPKKNEAIICDICSKKFSNAYNLRVRRIYALFYN
jgi:hypothetical protein